MKYGKQYFLTSVMVLCSASALQADMSIELAPHQITYQLVLKEAEPKTNIAAITGKTIFRVVRECDGWKSGEDYIMKMAFDDGNEVLMASLFESYENVENGLFSFTIDERSNYDKPLTFDGFAQQEKGRAGEAFFSIAPDSALSLPEDTFFPVGQTFEILRRAKAGDRFFTSHIFFGAKPDDALKKTSIIIGKQQSTNYEELTSDLLQDSYYPIQVAYFDPKTQTGIPSYEISFHMQDNGVVPFYLIDYGDFTLQAKMSDISKEPSPTCL
ncbi:MAG: EipB family protein [Candidatus Puniceispirillaceae bacterium]